MANFKAICHISPMKILLAVSGSISAYKAYDLLRSYLHQGHTVRVVLTKGAEQFVQAQMFRYLGAEAVYSSQEDFLYPKQVADNGTVLHIELARWCEQFVVAPLSANTLSRLARGEASDLLGSIFLSLEQNKPILIFPAMNTFMLDHPFTREHLNDIKRLKSLHQLFIHPTLEGELACGDVGSGKLAPIDEILELTQSFTANKNNKKMVITTGATVAPLDNVRFLTNSSNGTTGVSLAREALAQGYDVTVIAGIYATANLDLFRAHPRYTLERVRTPQEMLDQVEKYFPTCDIYISSAAVGDIEFVSTEGKLKKEKLSQALEIKPGVDILKQVLAMRTVKQKLVGFAAEYELSDENLHAKMERKKVDYLVGTKVNNGLLGNGVITGFRTENAHYAFLDPQGKIERIELSKSQMAKHLLDKVAHD
ncbi:MAG: bifunctional phosphopantothenoylcysteine decarboxylase/phosphopantothenate--cysteine ligase CoaBC [Bdellovibrio sp. CG12_big_fil_rev_8_21_14_0_65_39_13]|nr:MAG: bifunctional phosphopantothenoylcysteine decarboxylase/phosphopantothenate--cysteine ligase CoaBC [Bdellovibrio sp. CG22_combo_CG10-13_8_21_14_all_39_27]PIQ58478.1 MAG: bifunctional phosphopantothenoylcysteine decarboxylase/phosphopantothenate--cysteine ligase CoaBC [Bdellovibrio sp. CG12_big_fil_rev_8_21_14_0_65_39_13]PIR35429.1 MAG: bifunctional phosphopantothenoylcysteine decarboxylase/phosphopantothenate--cysteine ligase CoaBC [Bdellovibrio sp. CG11_big_fil_rev_8_21_14_0_20_39_38]PJB